MDSVIRYADVFCGCDTVNLPDAEGIAASWAPIKAMSGNTSPGALLPFGKISCSCYSGSYPGYYSRKTDDGIHSECTVTRKADVHHLPCADEKDRNLLRVRRIYEVLREAAENHRRQFRQL